jgi:ribosomal protein S18 acetylase RimI-like enzyme
MGLLMASVTDVKIREASESDIESLFDIRARTRENPMSRSHLASLGITPASWAAALRSGRDKTWVCFVGVLPVGFCAADSDHGEILVLAVIPEYEARGIGKQLLERAVRWLRTCGCRRLWLAANPDPNGRAHGFYRSQGWRPTGERADSGDEILVLTETPGARQPV